MVEHPCHDKKTEILISHRGFLYVAMGLPLALPIVVAARSANQDFTLDHASRYIQVSQPPGGKQAGSQNIGNIAVCIF